MKIRPATPRDAARLSHLIREIIDSSSYYSIEARSEERKKYTSNSVKELLQDKKYYLGLVALKNNEIVGFTLGRNEAGVFWIDWTGVRKNSRREGVATSLVKERERYLKQIGIHKIWCDTRTNNKLAIKLLAKLKYKKLGFFKNGWYKQDFFLWEKDLTKPQTKRAS